MYVIYDSRPDHLRANLARHEGYRERPYRCPAGRLTIGYGLNLDAGLPEDEAMLLLSYRVDKLRAELAATLACWPRLSQARQDVLINMAYNLGFAGLKKFSQMFAALDQEQYERAAAEMLDSAWARQVKGRAGVLAGLMRTGHY